MMRRGIRQRDNTDCGAACLVYIAGFYGRQVNLLTVRLWAGTNESGTSVYGLLQAAGKIGLDAEAARCPAELLTDLPCPCIAHCQIEGGRWHYVVVVMHKKNSLSIMDPTDGNIRTIPLQLFLEQWTGIVIFLTPGKGFEQAKSGGLAKKFVSLVLPFRMTLVYAVCCAIVYAFSGVLMSLYLQQVIDKISIDKDIRWLNSLSIMMVLLIAAQCFAGILRGRLMLQVSRKLDVQLNLGFLNHLLRLPRSFHNNMHKGDLLKRVNDATRISQFINNYCASIVVDVLFIIFSLVFMFFFLWKLALLVMLIMPFLLGIYFWADVVNKRLERLIVKDEAHVDGLFIQSAQSIDIIKLSQAEMFIESVMNQHFSRLLDHTRRSILSQLYFQSASETGIRLLSLGVIWMGTYFVFAGELSKGQLVSFYSLISYFSLPALSIITSGKQFRETMISAERYFEVMDLEKEGADIDKPRLPDKPIKANGDVGIAFTNITFRYGNHRPVFDHFSLHIPPNEITGISGRSGSGKTTLVSLLLGFYTIESGDIFIGEKNINTLQIDALRQQFGVVPQHPELLNFSIKENICLGSTPDLSKVEEVCERCGLSVFVDQLPTGLETIITDGGANFSGGQKQKIAIARALYRDAPILILDEPTSSLDRDAEDIIMQTIEWYKNKGRTVIIISHSDNALKICNNIVIL